MLYGSIYPCNNLYSESRKLDLYDKDFFKNEEFKNLHLAYDEFLYFIMPNYEFYDFYNGDVYKPEQLKLSIKNLTENKNKYDELYENQIKIRSNILRNK